MAARFLEGYRVKDEQVDKQGEGWRRHMVFGIKVLADFAKHGRIERAFTEVQAIHLPPALQKILRDYDQYCKDRLHLRPSTLHRRTTELTIFLDFLHSRKARTLDQIQALDLSEFVSCRDHLQPKTVARIVSDVRSFLRFLTMRGILPKDLSVALPKIRIPRDATIPSVCDHELIVRLLGAVDRSSAKGKRDYAILLLACRLGLRAGDILTLKLEHLLWEDSTIEIRQAKTGTPLSLPLTNEIGEALIDYLKSGRPQTTHREVFLRVNPPFDPFRESNNLHHIVTYWRRLAGITFRTPQKRGIHSLRHTLATRQLRVRDVDLNQGLITVRQGKFRKDRLVPPALPLVNRLRNYAAHFENRPLEAPFPAPGGGPFSLRTVYTLFRQLLLQCGIPHAGRGKGPRIHDYRHLFAVHTSRRWYRDGENLDAKLPLLATCLGHQHLSGTQRYLHLTAELFPEITARADAAFGDVIPRRIEP